MKHIILAHLLDWVLPVIVGLITPWAVDALKAVNTWLDESPAPVKQTLAVVIAGLITALSTIVGEGLPADLAQWDTAAVQTVVAALLGIAIKQRRQVKTLKTSVDTLTVAARHRI